MNHDNLSAVIQAYKNRRQERLAQRNLDGGTWGFNNGVENGKRKAGEKKKSGIQVKSKTRDGDTVNWYGIKCFFPSDWYYNSRNQITTTAKQSKAAQKLIDGMHGYSKELALAIPLDDLERAITKSEGYNPLDEKDDKALKKVYGIRTQRYEFYKKLSREATLDAISDLSKLERQYSKEKRSASEADRVHGILDELEDSYYSRFEQDYEPSRRRTMF